MGPKAKDLAWVKAQLRADGSAASIEVSKLANGDAICVRSEDNTMWIPCTFEETSTGRHVIRFQDDQKDFNVDMYRTIWAFKSAVDQNSARIPRPLSPLQRRRKTKKTSQQKAVNSMKRTVQRASLSVGSRVEVLDSKTKNRFGVVVRIKGRGWKVTWSWMEKVQRYLKGGNFCV